MRPRRGCPTPATRRSRPGPPPRGRRRPRRCGARLPWGRWTPRGRAWCGPAPRNRLAARARARSAEVVPDRRQRMPPKSTGYTQTTRRAFRHGGSPASLPRARGCDPASALRIQRQNLLSLAAKNRLAARARDRSVEVVTTDPPQFDRIQTQARRDQAKIDTKSMQIYMRIDPQIDTISTPPPPSRPALPRRRRVRPGLRRRRWRRVRRRRALCHLLPRRRPSW